MSALDSVVCDFEDGKAKNRVQFVNSVIKEEDWPDDWHGEHSNQGETEEEHHDEKGGDEAYVQYIGKGGDKKGGKGFQGY